MNETVTGTTTCRHCTQPIQLRNYALGPKWMHHRPGASFGDSDYEYCLTTRAEPTPQIPTQRPGGRP